MNDLIAPLVVGILALVVSKWILDNIMPKDVKDSEKTFYSYGGAALGAWVAMVHIVPGLKKKKA